MDPSNNNSIGTTHLPQRDHSNGYTDFLGAIHNFAAASEQQINHDDLEQYFDPALFASSAQDGPAASDQGAQPQAQQQTNYQSAFNQHAARQSQSPALPAYQPSQHHFTQHSQFTQPTYDPRANMFQNQQPTFDPRFYQQRPSHSPAPLEQYPYPPSNFSAQNYPQQQISGQRPQSSTQGPNFSQHQQSYSPFINFDSRNSGHMQTQNTHMMPFNAFQESNQKTSHGFVNPSMLNTSQDNYVNNQYTHMSQRPIQPSPYLQQAGQTIDPRSLGPSVVQPAQQKVGQIDQKQSGAASQFESNLPLKKKAGKDPNAPKRPRGRPRKDGSMPRQSGQGAASESGSDSDLSIEEEPEKTPALLSVQMPSDECGKAMFLAVQAVWSPRNLSAPVEKIKTGFAQFGEIIKGLRDSWKEKNESLKKAELPNASTADNAPRLKDEVAHYRQIVETVVTRSLQLAHPAILKRLGENQWTMSALYALMLDRVTVGDYDSTLILGILKLAVNFETLDEEKLEATKWPKLLQRLAKKATTESKSLSQQILSNAATATKKRVEKATNGDLAAGVKRGRDGEPVAVKKTIVKPSSKPLALQNAERRRAEAAEAAKKSTKAGPTVNGTTANAANHKAKVVVQQPPKLQSFAALMSASKKPGTSNAERAAAAKDKPALTNQQVKKESPPPNGSTTADSKGTSSLLGFLSALDKKEEVKPVKVDEPKNETPEQKEKRLRKEGRRKLRVSWKADSELVETRVFTHDPDEELGHTESSMRDAGDTTKEGEMLKRHKGMEDLDDDSDEDDAVPELAVEYTMPAEVDLKDLGDLTLNGIKFGGSLELTSPSREAQDKLESNTVMVVFASQADRPDTPKEPPDEGEDADFQPCVDFGEVPENIRQKEKEVYGRTPQPGPQGQNATGASGQMDISQILGLLKTQNVVPAQTAPTTGAQYDYQKLLQSVKQIQQIQQQYQPPSQSTYQPHPQPPPQPQTQPQNAQPAQAAGAPNLSSLLASFQQVAYASSAQTSLPLGAGGNPNPFPGASTGAEKHALDTSDYTQQKSGKKKKGNPPKTVVAADGPGGLPANYKTQTCQFWLEGKCNKGDHCTYRHDRIAS